MAERRKFDFWLYTYGKLYARDKMIKKESRGLHTTPTIFVKKAEMKKYEEG